jgi:PleD family two-component response regulator
MTLVEVNNPREKIPSESTEMHLSGRIPGAVASRCFTIGNRSNSMAKRILVVEDVDDSRSILVMILQRFCGYETIEATGTEAVEKALSEKPDLILMDLGLPDITGVDAAKALKGNLSTAHIPIVAHTHGR